MLTSREAQSVIAYSLGLDGPDSIGTPMTLKDREKSQNGARAQSAAANSRLPGPFLARLVNLDAQPTPLKLRPRQRIALGPAQDDMLFAVQSGVVTARAEMAQTDARMMALYFPGDVIAAGAIPCFSDRSIVAATMAEALRFKAKSLARLLAADGELLSAYERQRDRQLARASVHSCALATLDGPQRLAAFLIEMALEIGVASGPSISIDLPLSRTEIAQYLALNADTLSRLMSRFKADGLITQKSRHQVLLRNWRTVADLCPITPALIAIERNRSSPLS
jgi:CRP-like cAMP-binding protein